jgi:hypothetical protein
MPRGALAAQIGFWINLVDVQRDEIHRRAVMHAVPSISVKETIDDVLGVRMFEERRGDRR